MTYFFSKKLGPVLGGRISSKLIREEVEASVELCIFDFAEVRTLSHSFADELIGKLAESYGLDFFKKRVQIVNASQSVKNTIKFVLDDRLNKAA